MCYVQGVSGYLECQVCGHLSAGFEKSNQKAHFHEEHPLQDEVGLMNKGYNIFSSKFRIWTEKREG